MDLQTALAANAYVQLCSSGEDMFSCVSEDGDICTHHPAGEYERVSDHYLIVKKYEERRVWTWEQAQASSRNAVEILPCVEVHARSNNSLELICFSRSSGWIKRCDFIHRYQSS